MIVTVRACCGTCRSRPAGSNRNRVLTAVVWNATSQADKSIVLKFFLKMLKAIHNFRVHLISNTNVALVTDIASRWTGESLRVRCARQTFRRRRVYRHDAYRARVAQLLSPPPETYFDRIGFHPLGGQKDAKISCYAIERAFRARVRSCLSRNGSHDTSTRSLKCSHFRGTVPVSKHRINSCSNEITSFPPLPNCLPNENRTVSARTRCTAVSEETQVWMSSETCDFTPRHPMKTNIGRTQSLQQIFSIFCYVKNKLN